jgi:hypothetical protein
VSHTEGKLHYQEESDAYTHIARDVNGRIIFSTPQGSKGTDEANARRLVACWNACEGLPQDALDGGWTAAGISQYAKRLEGERDELMGALKQCQEALEPYDDIKPRDWKTDRERLSRAHQTVSGLLAKYKEAE